MNTMLAAKALLLRSFHDASRPLALANCWDVASALAVEAGGARAVATTSAGVAWSLGMPDGDRLDRDRALSVVAQITAAVQVPVTADIEGEYAHTAADVAVTVDALLELGAVGINIEDGTRKADERNLCPGRPQRRGTRPIGGGPRELGFRLGASCLCSCRARDRGNPCHRHVRFGSGWARLQQTRRPTILVGSLRASRARMDS